MAASCSAIIGANTVVLTVTDSNGGTDTANLTVNVTANTAPTVTYAAASVNAGASTTNSPTTATDNGSITGYAVQSAGHRTPARSASIHRAWFSISNAAPVVLTRSPFAPPTIAAQRPMPTFTLTVGNNAPTIMAGAALTRQRGSAGTVSTIATVSDTETAVGNLAVTADDRSGRTHRHQHHQHGGHHHRDGRGKLHGHARSQHGRADRHRRQQRDGDGQPDGQP